MDTEDEKLDILPTTVLAQVPPAHPQRPLMWWILGFITLVAGAFLVALRYANLCGELFIAVSDCRVADPWIGKPARNFFDLYELVASYKLV
jgi:hypothetical protein